MNARTGVWYTKKHNFSLKRRSTWVTCKKNVRNRQPDLLTGRFRFIRFSAFICVRKMQWNLDKPVIFFSFKISDISNWSRTLNQIM